jgi:16S rRNA G966 N2-methylase RsmD
MSAVGQVALSWPGRKNQIEIPPARLSPQLPAESEPWLVEGDNAAVLGALRKPLGGKVTLVYLDPPFLTQRRHHQVVRSRSKTGEVVRLSNPAFDDRWESLGSYLSELRVRLSLSRELLTSDGCLVLHVDPKTSHYAKILLDEIFGPECFASEIVWRYRRWPSKTPNFQRVHDVLLRYVRDSTKKPKFRQLYEPLAPSTQAVWGKGRQRAVVGPTGRRVRSSTESEESPGVPMGDVWDIGIVAPVAKERTGYPTQKPELLLARLIQACTDPGDLVLDPYMGSGTTLAACLRYQRRMVGIDQNPEAVRLTLARLRALGAVPVVSRVVEPACPSVCRISVEHTEVTSPGKKRVA